MAVDPNTGVSTTKLVRPDPQLLDTGLVLDRDPGECKLGPSRGTNEKVLADDTALSERIRRHSQGARLGVWASQG